MIEDSKVERLGGAGQFSRGAAVRIARPGVSQVMMGQHPVRAAKSRRVDDDFPDRLVDGFRLALIAFDVEAALRMVDVSHPRPFVRLSLGPKAG